MRIPIDTPAFQSYAAAILITNAALFNQVLNLGPVPLETNRITSLSAYADLSGISAGVQLDHRYAISIEMGRVFYFLDKQFGGRTFMGNDKRCGELLTMTNLLTEKSAMKLARDVMAKLQLNEKEFGEGRKLRVNQYFYEDDNNKRWPLPYYRVGFGESHLGYVEVSGVTSNVAYLSNHSPKTGLKIPRPTNYFQMLGLDPSNTVFQTKRGLILDPNNYVDVKTNSPPKSKPAKSRK